jgi:hypothetical protein
LLALAPYPQESTDGRQNGTFRSILFGREAAQCAGHDRATRHLIVDHSKTERGTAEFTSSRAKEFLDDSDELFEKVGHELPPAESSRNQFVESLQ